MNRKQSRNTNDYLSPRDNLTTDAKLRQAMQEEDLGIKSPNLRISINVDKKTKTVGKKSSGLRSLDLSMRKVKTQQKSKDQSSILPSSTSIDQ